MFEIYFKSFDVFFFSISLHYKYTMSKIVWIIYHPAQDQWNKDVQHLYPFTISIALMASKKITWSTWQNISFPYLHINRLKKANSLLKQWNGFYYWDNEIILIWLQTSFPCPVCDCWWSSSRCVYSIISMITNVIDARTMIPTINGFVLDGSLL